MAKVTNSNFISFIKAHGPWIDNDMQYEEHRRAKAEKCGVEPLEYEILDSSCFEQLKATLEAHKSKIILICGRAGDGKTHLLGQLFERSDLLDLGTRHFKELLTSENAFKVFNDVKGFNLTVVSDLSQMSEDSEEEQRLYSNIMNVVDTINTKVNAASAGTGREQHPEIVLIAGNNGKILEKLDTLVKDWRKFSTSGNEDNGTRLEELRNKLKCAFVENKKVTLSGVVLIDMSNRVNLKAVKKIFEVMLRHECWKKCNDCDCQEQCPILRNREVLLYPWVQKRLLNVLHLLKTDGFHLTVRTVQSLIVNALLGRGFEYADKYTDLTCLKIKHNIEANNGKCKFTSNVYDNLLGLNFKPESRLGRDIFRAMNSLKLGQHTSKVIDDFLLTKNMENEVFKQFIENYGWPDSKRELQEAQEELRNNSLSKGKEINDDLVAAQEKFSLKLQALRRGLFFNIGASLEQQKSEVTADYSCDSDEQLNKWKLGSPYLMTCYPHALDYFELERLAKDRNKDQIKISKVAHNLILALNRMFTELFSEDNENVYIPASSINNQSILYSSSDFSFKSYESDNKCSINLELHSEIDIPVLRFVYIKQNDNKRKEVKADLVLTPYMFECLMQIADGVSSLCLPKQAVYEVRVFQNKIFSILESQESTLFTEPNLLLSSLKILEVGNT